MVKVLIEPKVGRLVLTHPGTGDKFFDDGNGNLIEGILYIVGTSSKEFRNALKAITPTNYIDIINGKDEELENRLLAGCIVGWENTGFIFEEYSPENALDLISEPKNFWIKVQVKNFIDNQANFFSVVPNE